MLELNRERLESIMSMIGEDEDFGRAVRMEIEERFSWSLAYFDEYDLRLRFASDHGYDEAGEVPDDLWNEVWSMLRNSYFWREAGWSDDFVGDHISYWLDYEKRESFGSALQARIAAWEVD